MFRILVAEDDDSARFLMCEVLRRAGYEPCPARDGVEALEVMEHYQCDLAVVDEEEMLWRIEALLRRYCSRADRRLTVGSTVLDRGSLQVITPQGVRQLAAKEFLLLYKLLSYPRTLFTKRQLIDDIWDLDSEVDEHTVEVYISRLREKFRDDPDFELRTIRGFGYMGIPREDNDGQK